jgi:diguanylate cyclase
MDQENKVSIITEIQNEYEKINGRWLLLHYRTFIGLVVFAFLVECVLGMVIYQIGSIKIPLERYVLNYIFSSLVINSLFTMTAVWAMRNPRFPQIKRTYVISLLFVGVCFVLYTIHIVFNSLFLIFSIPILLTIVYGNRLLTTVTAILSISSKIISDLLITWDPDKVSPLADSHELISFIVSICILAAFYVVCVIIISFEKEKYAVSIHKEIERYQMRQKLITDDLTQVYNRIALRKAFQDMENDRADHTYILAMIDIDNFKTLNDTLGHDTGDRGLTDFGAILKKYASDDLKPFRFGGDEFCILFRNSEIGRVIEWCKRIQNDLKEITFQKLGIPLTVSVGIACYQKGMSAKQLLHNTDSALYRSKTEKGSVFVFGDTDRCVPYSAPET